MRTQDNNQVPFVSTILFHRDEKGNYVAHCPWHAENENLDLALSPSRGIFHCFKCGIGGKIKLPPDTTGEQLQITAALHGKKGAGTLSGNTTLWWLDVHEVRHYMANTPDELADIVRSLAKEKEEG